MEEIWKDIKDYEGYYAASNLGRIKSLERVIDHSFSGQVKIKERILKPGKDKKGQCSVMLSKDNIQVRYCVHHLIAELFLENPNKFRIVRHLNGNYSDNKIQNLRYCAAQEVQAKGNAKLDLLDALTIRSLKGKVPVNTLCSIFNVGQTCIYNIFHNRTW